MRLIQPLNILALLLFLTGPHPLAQNETHPFRFHSALEPTTVDPAALIESTGGFLFFNLYRSLYRLDQNNVPQPELAKKCVWKNQKTLVCTLKKDLKFSNGTPIKADHWVAAWRRLVDPKVGSRHSELLMSVLHASEIIRGKNDPQKLGVAALQENILEIQLDRPDAEFLYKISSPLLTPLLSEPPKSPQQFTNTVGTGPYRVVQWLNKTRIQLEPNPFYPIQNNRPPVEVLIVKEDSTALQLYDLGKLDFLRRLNIKEIPSRKSRKDFYYIPTYRFDYIGFGPALQNQDSLRQALSLSLRYPELTKAYLTPGIVGCPSLPASLSQPWPCLKMNLKSAKIAWDKVKEHTQPLTLTFSSAGGEDIQRGMEWMQSQWKKHLNLDIRLEPLESGMFFQKINTNRLTLFRKGTNLDRPTCLAALENFTSDSRDNNLGFKDPKYDQLIAKLQIETKTLAKKKLCGQALQILISQHRLIPLGELYFAMLAKPDFKGWRVTPLNQLDLTNLQFKP